MPKRQINKLSRYTKVSDRLVLEEHSHCEVPAGCGGVVLRWRDPAEGLPVELWLLTSGEAAVYLDGQKVVASRPILSYGPHQLAIRFTGKQTSGRRWPRPVKTPSFGILMFAAVVEVGPPAGKAATTSFVSAADGTWKYIAREPEGELWTMPEFDDSSWIPMREQALDKPGETDYGRANRLGKLIELGAVGLGPREDLDRLWIRKPFVLTDEGLR